MAHIHVIGWFLTSRSLDRVQDELSEAYVTLGRLSHVKARHREAMELIEKSFVDTGAALALDSAIEKVRGEVSFFFLSAIDWKNIYNVAFAFFSRVFFFFVLDFIFYFLGDFLFSGNFGSTWWWMVMENQGRNKISTKYVETNRKKKRYSGMIYFQTA